MNWQEQHRLLLSASRGNLFFTTTPTPALIDSSSESINFYFVPYLFLTPFLIRAPFGLIIYFINSDQKIFYFTTIIRMLTTN